MARYNLSRYNLAHYNRTVDSATTFDKLKAAALFNAYIGLGQTTKDTLIMQSVYNAAASIAAGTIESSQLETAFDSDITGTYIAYGHDAIAGNFDQEIEMANIVMDKTPQAATFQQKSNLGPVVKDKMANSATFSCKSNMGNIVMDPEENISYAIFGAAISAESLEEFVLTLSCTIPAGGTLVVDSDNFRVLLNGNNAIKYHSGDWIDELSRQSEQIKIEGGASSLTASIYFQELWL